MKNDFDFIKEKIENSGVKAPAKMDEKFVLDRIAGVEPTQAQPGLTLLEPKKQKPKRRYGRFTAIAAAIVAVAVLGTALTVHFSSKRAVELPAADKSTGLIRFNDYDEVRAAMQKLSERSARNSSSYGWVTDDADFAYAGEPEAVSDGYKATTQTSGSSQNGGSQSHSETYKQVEGVDEADCIKTDGRYIYVIDCKYDENGSRVSIFPATPGVTDPILRLYPGQQSVKEAPATDDESTPDEKPEAVTEDDDPAEYMDVLDLFIRDDRLIMITSSYRLTYRAYWNAYDDSNTQFTRIYVYDVADMADVKLLDTFTQSGSYTSSRMIGDTLYLITNEYSISDIPCCGRGASPDEMPADCIYSVEDPEQSSFLIVSAYDTLDYTAVSDSKAVLGLGSDVYCSEDNLYISAEDYSGYYRLYGAVDYAVEDSVVTYGEGEDADSDADAGEEDDDESVKTKIFKVSLSGGVNFVAYGEVVGTTNNQYSFDEYNGYLRVATTEWRYNRLADDYEDVNNLFVLDGDLNLVGSVTGFAPTESIKAVRYVGNTAYVITYVQTDPLFVIDLSAPTAPAILGEVKISGFSTMLVPIDENTILGLGYNTGEADYTDLEVTDGFKLALFDVSDKTNPKVLDSRSYVDYNSAVMYDPKALVYNPDRDDFVVPISYWHYEDNGDDWYADDDNYDEWENRYESHVEQFGGALNFRVESGRIVETDLYRSRFDWIERCVYVGDTIYLTAIDDTGAVHLDSVSYR